MIQKRLISRDTITKVDINFRHVMKTWDAERQILIIWNIQHANVSMIIFFVSSIIDNQNNLLIQNTKTVYRVN